MNASANKPWPADALIVVASEPEKYNLAAGPSFVFCCRDCRAPVRVSSTGLVAATLHPQRCDRPVDFLCPSCCITYDPHSLDELDDLRTSNQVTDLREALR